MRRLPRQYGDMPDKNICPRCGKIHNSNGESHSCEHPGHVQGAPEAQSARREDHTHEHRREQPPQSEKHPPHYDPPRHAHPQHDEHLPPRHAHPQHDDRRAPRHRHSQYDERRRAPQYDEKRPHNDNCRCPNCGHAFVWPPEPCPRCGKVHLNRKPFVSPGASTFTPEIFDKPGTGGFSRLFGENALLGALMMLSLFGGGMNGVSEVRQMFMHPMFQLLDLMNNMKGGGNLLDILGPLLNGQDAGALGDILASMGKGNIY